jgi:hypothetical protein
MKPENHDEHSNLYFWNPNVIKYKLLFFLIKEGTDLPIGAIIGGCVGGLFFILIILMIYFICSRKSQNINAIATTVHENNKEVGISGPLKKPDQTSAFDTENIYSSGAKIDNTSQMTAVHVNDIEVGTSKPLKESDQTSAFSLEDFHSSKANRENVIAENKRMQAKNEQIRLAKQERIDDTTPSIPDPSPWVSGW